MVTGISIVIPNFNGIKLFPDTLTTVKEAMKNAQKPSEIIIVDDYSTDNSIAYLEENYPEITIVKMPSNKGFSFCANVGVKTAKYDKVLLLNSDVKLSPDYFQHQYKYFDKEDTFGVMGRIIGWDDELIQDGAKYPSFHGAKIKTSGNYILRDKMIMRGGLYSMYLSGANAFVDKEKFIAIGGFNEAFSPFYIEDYELSLRAWRLGFKCYYDFESVCQHKTSTSINKSNKKSFVDIIYNRNKMILHALHLQGARKLLWYFQLILESFIQLIMLRWRYLKSLRLFLSSTGEIRSARKQFTVCVRDCKSSKSVNEVAVFIMDDIKVRNIIKF
ncbi:MAG TPA: glycosyltransferase [Ferruginibacter sp.]|jgi:GT2 family glycosyltransferase|nr:glycosyltransferase [Ferruginibacter sp.]